MGSIVTDADAFAFGPFRLLPGRRELLAQGVPVMLGQRALEILLVLVGRHGQLVTKDELMAEIWPGVVVEENTLQVHISALRKVLGAVSPGERHILTVAGRGYRFVAPVERGPASPVAGDVAVVARRSPSDAAAPAVRPVWNNLPQPLTPLIGREADLSEVGSRLRQHRLVTIVGAGGVGKTRLAVAAGNGLIEKYADGAAIAELAPLHDPQLAALLIADILGMSVVRQDVSGELGAALKDRHLLLILDNCEHVIAEVARVADRIVRTCPRVSILATSREPLSIPGESVFRLPSLSVPESDEPLTAMIALACPAVRLFVERASALGDGFELTDEHATTVASICRRLDGIPLAIELAASRLNVLSIGQLARGLDERFRLLTAGSRTALKRHQTLQALLDWSYDLLSEPEQCLLRCLGVFAGSTTLASIAAVASGGTIAQGQVLDLLSLLVDKSLVSAEIEGDVPRYRLVETTRCYAQGKAAECRESNLQHRHARHFVDRLAAATAEWETTATDAWLARYGGDADNVRAALDWGFGPDGDMAVALELVGYSHVISAELGLMSEHRRWVEQALRRIDGTTSRTTVARLLSWRAGDVRALDDATDYDDAMRAAAIYAELGDTFRQGQMLLRAGASRLIPERSGEGEHILQQAYALLHPRGPTKTLAQCLSALASARLFAADLSAAQSFHERAVAINHEIEQSGARLFDSSVS